MTIKTLDKITKRLGREVALLRSFVIGQSKKDSEGEYNPNFVKKILKASEENPKHEFFSREAFLKHIREK